MPRAEALTPEQYVQELRELPVEPAMASSLQYYLENRHKVLKKAQLVQTDIMY